MGGVDFIVIVVIKIKVEFGEIFNGRILLCKYVMVLKCVFKFKYFNYVMELFEVVYILIKNFKRNIYKLNIFIS